jgi:hypothetical protein
MMLLELLLTWAWLAVLWAMLGCSSGVAWQPGSRGAGPGG